MKKLIRLLLNKPIKYEVMKLQSHSDYINDKIQDAQNVGWEIAGEIHVNDNQICRVIMKRPL